MLGGALQMYPQTLGSAFSGKRMLAERYPTSRLLDARTVRPVGIENGHSLAKNPGNPAVNSAGIPDRANRDLRVHEV